jgi:hypothetical protein
MGVQFQASAGVAGDVFDWNPFQVKAYLKPGNPLSAQPDKLINGDDIPYINFRDVYEPAKNVPIRSDASAGFLQLRISRLVMNPGWRDVKEEERREQLNSEILRSMPSMITDWKGRESLENMGKYFEPKVNLELRF